MCVFLFGMFGVFSRAPIFGCPVLGQAIFLASSPNLVPEKLFRVRHEILLPFLNFVNHYFWAFFFPHTNAFGEGAHVQHEGL